MNTYICTMPWSTNMQNQKLLSLCCHSFCGCGNVYLKLCFSRTGHHYFEYTLLPHSVPHFGQDARPKIVDTPLRLIFRMGQGAFRYHFCHLRQPILRLRMFTTNPQLHYPGCKTKNHWCSVDAQFQDWAGSALLLFLPVKAANTWLIDVSNQSPVRLPKIQDQKLLTLHWCSFPG